MIETDKKGRAKECWASRNHFQQLVGLRGLGLGSPPESGQDLERNTEDDDRPEQVPCSTEGFPATCSCEKSDWTGFTHHACSLYAPGTARASSS